MVRSVSGAVLRLVLACSFAVTAAGVARAQSADQLYAAAQAEKSLVFYSGGPAEPFERMAKQFEARFPGVSVSVTGGFSNVLDAKINDQLKAKQLEVDMAFFQTV